MLCPVDLAACDRLQCRGGHCRRADVACLVICSECGAVEERVVAGVCVGCLAVFAAAQTVEER